jgi:hypothetical protein
MEAIPVHRLIGRAGKVQSALRRALLRFAVSYDWSGIVKKPVGAGITERKRLYRQQVCPYKTGDGARRQLDR